MATLALVTGAAGDIGRAICKRLLNDGYGVAALDHDGAALERALPEFGAGADVAPVVADITDGVSVTRAIARVEDAGRAIGVLVNNAGGVLAPTLATTDEAAWRRDIDLNLTGAWICANAVRPRMVARQAGVIVNIASVNGMAIFGHPAYSTAKAGLLHLTRFLAVELGKYSIRANAVCPGTVRTQAWNERAERNPEIFEQVRKWYPLGEICRPEDVAGVVAFLVGDDARMITGLAIVVDGGLTAGSSHMASEFCGTEL